MDETRRFLRYVMPGIVYGLETIFLLWITCPTWIEGVISSNMGKDVGTVLGSVLVFGGLGYIFSTIHHVRHCMCNQACKEQDRILDHRLIANDLLKSKKVDDPVIAMAISYAEWYKQMNWGNIGDDANKKVCSLGDQAHGLGTANIASFFSLATSTLVICSTDLCCSEAVPFRFLVALLLGVWITYWFNCGYERVGKIAHETYEKILCDAAGRAEKRSAFRRMKH